ncbi:MAG: glutathione-disulfide reductase [Defluviicoccus sp.]|nr:glutathione-disulfide reductase [Defluviicoccus sp.]MDE0382859.1 glutathione-disulfide reductase [Defluviicoccus sp.]
MAGYDYDLFVIGAGSGGVRAARMSASYGARVGIAEERFLGGTCVNVGCIPKKLFAYGAHYREDAGDAAAFGWSFGEPALHWPTLIANKNREIERLNGIYRRILEANDVRIHESRARFVDAHTLDVDGELVTAETVLIAVGGRPQRPAIPGGEHAITSEEAFYLEQRPDRVLIVGGGYIAVEFAGIFKGYGAEVVQAYRGPLFMRGFDMDIRTHLAEEMAKKGVDIRWRTTVERIDPVDGRLACALSSGETVTVDQAMYAIGRVPNVADLGLEAVGVETRENGAIGIDDRFRTSVENIYALGDVTDRLQLTPVAIAEAMVLAANLYDGRDLAMDYADIATAVFSNPNVGTVGLTEEQARERYGAIDVYREAFRPLKHTLTEAQDRTMMKLVVDRGSDRVVGCHMVGPDAAEITQGLGIALKCGATKAQFDATVGIHPTAAEEFVTMRSPAPEPEAQAAE